VIGSKRRAKWSANSPALEPRPERKPPRHQRFPGDVLLAARAVAGTGRGADHPGGVGVRAANPGQGLRCGGGPGRPGAEGRWSSPRPGPRGGGGAARGGIAAAESGECEWRRTRWGRQAPGSGRQAVKVVASGCAGAVCRCRRRRRTDPADHRARPRPSQRVRRRGESLSDPHRLAAIARVLLRPDPQHAERRRGDDRTRQPGQDRAQPQLEPVGTATGAGLEETQPAVRTPQSRAAAGRIQALCSLPEHDEKGMHTTITVVP